MKFDLNQSYPILERTPLVLQTLLQGLDSTWTHQHEGPDTWSPFDVVGHLIVCEKTDFITRTHIILSDEAERKFPPLDMTAQFTESIGKTMDQLLSEFASLRREKLQELMALQLQPATLQRTGAHQVLGEVSLSQLLATWVAHDMVHLAQIARVMAKQYREAIGPFLSYMRVMQS
ncbi:DinB family protein [Flavihumibacter petaseus]|uniref:DinB-like domain-containing protein n=1 Tax=Flavihumibacter petaseus NBRC 106054 TaxID=1220578 RepID=A0A0E9N4C9_9BACT|nr:DinB family protein [Flavihumibacter petaseus]GAO44516.1 hypothetical protein FPE01S_03_05530 [Flavihumibacter petaseus NBRC 106054]